MEPSRKALYTSKKLCQFFNGHFAFVKNLRSLNMALQNIVRMPLILVCAFLSVSCSHSKNQVFMCDAYEVDSLCGSAYEGEPPCAYVEKLNFSISGYMSDNFTLEFSANHLKKWVADREKFFSGFNIVTTVNYRSRSGWANRPDKDDKNIEVSFSLSETPDKKHMLIAFYTFSKSEFILQSRQCQMDVEVDKCIANTFDDLLEKSVVKSIALYRS